MYQEPIQVAVVAQHFHRGEFGLLRSILTGLQRNAATGRLRRCEQVTLLELAEYGLFYTSFYDTIIRRMTTGGAQE